MTEFANSPIGGFAASGAYFDVNATLQQGTSLGGAATLTLQFHDLSANVPLLWWNGSGWTAVLNSSGQAVTSDAQGNAMVTFSGVTVPTLAQLTGTYFMAGSSKVQPQFNVAAQGAIYGTSTVTFTGSLAGGSMIPSGTITATLGSETELAAIQANGSFSVTFDNTARLGVLGGPYSVSFSYAGDSQFLAAYGSSQLTVTPAQLKVTANNQSMVYGATLPVLTGTLSGVVGGDGITATYSTTATSSSGVVAGGYPITATLHDPNNRLGNYTVTNTPGTLSIKAAPTSTMLIASANFLAGTQSVTFTASVTANAPSTAAPTGSVDLFDQTTGKDLGRKNLSGGSVSWTTSNLAVGSHTMVATYSSSTINVLGSQSSLNEAVEANVTFAVQTAAGANSLSSKNNITVHYTKKGIATSAVIWNGHSVTDIVDPNSAVAYDQISSGSTGSERWEATTQPTFTVTASKTLSTTYFDQLLDTLAAGTASGGTRMSATNYVTANYAQFGGGQTARIYDGHNASVWADRGSQVTYGARSSGSNSSERWQANAVGTSPSFAVSTPGTLTATYADQLLETLAAGTASGGTRMSATNYVTANYAQFGGGQTARILRRSQRLGVGRPGQPGHLRRKVLGVQR